jgi:hypothetical protein
LKAKERKDMVSGVKINQLFNTLCPIEKLDDLNRDLQALARKYDVDLVMWSPTTVNYSSADKK